LVICEFGCTFACDVCSENSPENSNQKIGGTRELAAKNLGVGVKNTNLGRSDKKVGPTSRTALDLTLKVVKNSGTVPLATPCSSAPFPPPNINWDCPRALTSTDDSHHYTTK
jgi:hypothetical protein